MREFFTGPAVKIDLLAVWLEKLGIPAQTEPVEPGPVDKNDLNREFRVLVSEADFDRARRLFFEEREDEL